MLVFEYVFDRERLVCFVKPANALQERFDIFIRHLWFDYRNVTRCVSMNDVRRRQGECTEDDLLEVFFEVELKMPYVLIPVCSRDSSITCNGSCEIAFCGLIFRWKRRSDSLENLHTRVRDAIRDDFKSRGKWEELQERLLERVDPRFEFRVYSYWHTSSVHVALLTPIGKCSPEVVLVVALSPADDGFGSKSMQSSLEQLRRPAELLVRAISQREDGKLEMVE